MVVSILIALMARFNRPHLLSHREQSARPMQNQFNETLSNDLALSLWGGFNPTHVDVCERLILQWHSPYLRHKGAVSTGPHSSIYNLAYITTYNIGSSYQLVKQHISKSSAMIYGYIRVSSDKQTVENQRFEINNFCERQNLVIDGWIEETISGTKAYNKRELGKLLKRVQKDDLIICAELSRLGRNLFMIMEILNICMTKECRVWTIKDNYRLGDDIQSKVLAFAFGLSAEIERNLISQRTKEALARLKSEGKPIGRSKGRRNNKLNQKCESKHMLIIKALSEGTSIPQIAKKIKVARGTLYRYLAYTGIRLPTKSTNGRWARGIY